MGSRTRRVSGAALGLALMAAFGCDVETMDDIGGDRDDEFRDLVLITEPDVAVVPAPLAGAFCSIKVVGKGTYDIETDYLPRTVFCENGGADFEALKAQAIAARSVVYYEAARDGSICDSESCQVATCKGSPEETLQHVPDDVFRAVEETSGMYLSYSDTLTYGFYVAGSTNFVGDTCIGKEGDAATEKWVTYNNGKDGFAVEQTALGTRFDPDDNEYGQNRGCMSQWGARCLEKAGADAIDILNFYYGEDIEIVQAEGECIDEDASLDNEGAECGDHECTGTEDEDSCPEDCEPCGTIASDDRTVIEETDRCFDVVGDDEYIRVDTKSGHDDALLWTETTAFEAYNVGTWHFNFERPGEYLVEVWVEPGYGEETRARYLLTHDGEETNVRVNQDRGKGWVRLGVFTFEEGHHDQSLKLTDLSTTPGNKLVFDAVRVSPAELAAGNKGDEVPTAGSVRRGEEQGCSIGGDRSGWWLGFAALALFRLRRRCPRVHSPQT